ncbi:ATP-dependent zinc protease [Psychromonas sp.]|nr:ATP-dependent zinc protease [Psychromonas sp.]
MILKKAAIITLSTFFLTVGCASTSTPDSTTEIKISGLESALVQSQTEIAQAQTEIAQEKLAVEQANIALENAKKEAAELSEKLKQQIAVNESKTNNSDVLIEKVTKRDSYLDKTVLGEAEWIYITKAKENFKARIDTGATTSSINAVNIQRFERDGEKWVKFNITHSKDEKESYIEAPIVRIAKIIQSSKPGEETERPVVKLHVRIGDLSQQSEFTLTNRLHMEYPVLIGRTFMQDVVLVDVSQEYIHPKYQAKDKK